MHIYRLSHKNFTLLRANKHLQDLISNSNPDPANVRLSFPSLYTTA